MNTSKLIPLLLFLQGSYLIDALSVPPSPIANFGPQVIENQFQPNTGDGSYYFKYVIDDGSEREETGTVNRPAENVQFISVKGSYGYRNNEGTLLVTYVADENGFRPVVVWNLIPQFESFEPRLGHQNPSLSFDSPRLSTSDKLRGSLLGGGII